MQSAASSRLVEAVMLILGVGVVRWRWRWR